MPAGVHLSVRAGKVGDPSGLRKQWHARGGWDTPIVVKLCKQLAADVRAGRCADRPVPAPQTLKDLYDLGVRYKGAALEYPHHLQPYLDVLQRAAREAVTVCFSAPPQHHKTTTTLMVLASLLLTEQDRSHFYVTYSGTRARDVSRDLSHLLQQLGVPHDASNAVVTYKGSTVRFVGLEQGITGYSCNGLCVIDDPFKNPQEAKSSAVREAVWRGYLQNVQTRQQGRMSVVAMCTRWDVDDLIGRMSRNGVRYINLKAVCDDDASTPEDERDPLGRSPGQPLLASIPDPGRDMRDNDERAWHCMYQGEAVPEGMRLFETETTYQRLPNVPLVVLYGLDSAYAGKRGSDWSVFVRFLHDPATRVSYLDRVVRCQKPIGLFGREAAEVQSRRPGPVTWFVGGQEQYAAADVLRREGVKRLECVTARGQLRVRASKVAAAWNSGKVLVPAVQDLATRQFIEEVTTFTGDDRAHDDCVAAMHGALHSAVLRGVGPSPANQVLEQDPAIERRRDPRGRRTVLDYERELSARLHAARRPVGYEARR